MSNSGSSAQFGDYVQPSLGHDFDVYHDQLQQQAIRKEMLDYGPAPEHEASISMKMHKARQVAESGRIVNGFAPYARLLNTGHDYEEARRYTEHHLFGTPMDAPHHDRPIYGYVRDARNPDDGPYGNVVMDIAPRRGREVTTTPGDSLDLGLYTHNVENLSNQHVNDTDHYREVQFHGGPINLKEVKRAHLFGRGSYADLTPNEETWRTSDALRQAGVRTTVYRMMEHQPTLDQEMFGRGKVGWVDAEAHRPSGPRVRTGQSPRQMYGRRT